MDSPVVTWYVARKLCRSGRGHMITGNGLAECDTDSAIGNTRFAARRLAFTVVLRRDRPPHTKVTRMPRRLLQDLTTSTDW